MLLHEYLPDADGILELEPEELAGHLIAYLNQLPESEKNNLNRPDFFLKSNFEVYPSDQREAISRALTESWMWLEREGLLAPQPEKDRDWVFITRRGEKIEDPDILTTMRNAALLPRQTVHPRIAQKVWALFLRGDYGTAIFHAFKEVEAAVREAGGFEDEEYGPRLMNKAFDPDGGPLTDTSLPKLESEALACLFAGSMRYYRNPFGHEHVNIKDPTEAVEMIMIASHLLGVVDERSS